MRIFLPVMCACLAVASAESVPQGGYSGGNSFSGGSFNFGSGGYTTGFGRGSNNDGASAGGYGAPGGAAGGFGATGGSDADANQAPQVFKYVSIHAAPEDPDDHATRTVRVPGGNQKHVNIVFIKSPSNGADQKTEVILPQQDEFKTAVYLLVPKIDPTANLQIRKPQPTQPSKPSVFFIKYKNAPQQPGQSGDAPASGGAIPVGDFNRGSAGTTGSAPAFSPAYGVPLK